MGGFVVRIGINPAQQVGSAIIPEATPTSDGVMTAAQAAALAALSGNLGGFSAEGTSVNNASVEVGRVKIAGDGEAQIVVSAAAAAAAERAVWFFGGGVTRAGALVLSIDGSPLPSAPPTAFSGVNAGGYRVTITWDALTSELVFSVTGALGETVKFAVTVTATIALI